MWKEINGDNLRQKYIEYNAHNLLNDAMIGGYNKKDEQAPDSVDYHGQVLRTLIQLISDHEGPKLVGDRIGNL
jgi:hypothetical protein